MKKQKQTNITYKNKKAFHDYEDIENRIAGIVLTGMEMKSIRNGQVNLSDSYCRFAGNELFVHHTYISNPERFEKHQHDNNLRDFRPRKLLLRKHELKHLKQMVKEKGLTIIPLYLFIDERGFAKMQIALCRGRHTYDKKEAIKRKDLQREASRQLE